MKSLPYVRASTYCWKWRTSRWRKTEKNEIIKESYWELCSAQSKRVRVHSLLNDSEQIYLNGLQCPRRDRAGRLSCNSRKWTSEEAPTPCLHPSATYAYTADSILWLIDTAAIFNYRTITKHQVEKTDGWIYLSLWETRVNCCQLCGVNLDQWNQLINLEIWNALP